MPNDLGGRLAQAGLVTRADLAELLATAPPHDAALVRALVRRGVPEDALAGFFLSEGFGPLLETADLERADTGWAARLPGAMALDFLALPLRAATDGVVVAMAAPSDPHIVRELGRVLGARVLATVARPSQIEARVRALSPDAPSAPPPARPASEPPVLELTRRRAPSTAPARGFDAGFRAPDGSKDGKLGPRLALSEDEVAMPLVRHKPSAPPSKPPSQPPIETQTVVARTFARPDAKERARGGVWGRGAEPRRSNTQPLIPAIAPFPDAAATPAQTPTVVARPPTRPPTTLEGALTDLAERVSEVPPAPVPAPVAAPGKPSPPDVVAPAASPAPVASATPATAPLAPAPTATPTEPPSATKTSPALGADERWDLPSTPPAAPSPGPRRDAANKLSPRATADLPTIKAAPGDIGAILAAMRGAKDRDEVVRLACEGATSVARAAVFFALRKGVLKGWDGAGPGVRRDSVRNLWIPTSSASTFKKVLDAKAGCVGPYGTSVADGLFRAAVGSRGGDFMVQPVVVAGKVVAMLCVDDLRPGPLGAHRVEVLSQTVGDAFVRIIAASKD